MNEGLGLRGAVLGRYGHVGNVALSALVLVDTLNVIKLFSLGSNVLKICALANESCRESLDLRLGSEQLLRLGLGLCVRISQRGVQGIGNRLFDSGRGNGSTGEGFHLVDIVSALACEIVGISGHSALSVSFRLLGNHGLGDLALGVNADGNSDLTCIALGNHGNHVTLKLAAVGNLVKALGGSGCALGESNLLKLAVQNDAQRVVDLLLLCLFDNRRGDKIHSSHQCRNHQTDGTEHCHRHNIFFFENALDIHYFLPPKGRFAVHFSM